MGPAVRQRCRTVVIGGIFNSETHERDVPALALNCPELYSNVHALAHSRAFKVHAVDPGVGARHINSKATTWSTVPQVQEGIKVPQFYQPGKGMIL